MASDVIDALRAQLARTFKLQAAPPVGVRGEISPNLLLGSLNGITPSFELPNVLFAQATAPIASQDLVVSPALDEACYDIMFQGSSGDPALQRFNAVVRNSGGTSVMRWRFDLAGSFFQQEVALHVPAGHFLAIASATNWTAATVANVLLAWRKRTCTH